MKIQSMSFFMYNRLSIHFVQCEDGDIRENIHKGFVVPMDRD